MWRLIYQIGIQLLFIYFKIASTIGDKKAIEGSVGRKKWKIELKKLNKGLTTYWIHAASHGEGLMAVPLIKKLLKSENNQVIISFFSPSGYKNFNYTNSKLIKTYIPLDSRKNAREIVRIINPKHLMFVKYDLWLNIIDECQKNKIPGKLYQMVKIPSWSYLANTKIFIKDVIFCKCIKFKYSSLLSNFVSLY